MGGRPNWRAVFYWLRKPVYVSIGFTVLIFLVIVLDRQMGLWGGSIARYVPQEEKIIPAFWAVVLVPMLLWNLLRIATTAYEIGEKQFVFSRGIFNRKKYVVHYENIQNINVERSFLEMLLMLSTVRIETAGSKPGEAELKICGVASGQTERLVRDISRRVEEAKAEKAGGGREVNVNLTGYDRRLERLEDDVGEIKKELEAVTKLLEKEKRKKDWESMKE